MSATAVKPEAPVESLAVAAYAVPTDAPEGDGTLRWDATTMVAVHAAGGGETGFGLTYADRATATLIATKLADAVSGCDALAPPAAWERMVVETRNLGRPGITSMAIAAVDLALWDLKARLHGVALCTLLGPQRRAVPLYGSGGFTTYSTERLVAQLEGWAGQGFERVKMKIGSDPGEDPARAAAVRAAIGPDVELFVDANGAHDRKRALLAAERLRAVADVSWFEEPVSSDDLEGLRLLRDRAPAGIAIAAGEYGYDLPYFRRMLEAGAVDVLQADVTRCAGITELLRIDGLCRAAGVPLSLHCGPAMHGHPACALDSLAHLEYFHDHVRIESMLLDGLPELRDGALWPDRDRPGNGLELKRSDAEGFEVR